ncbi:MAG: DUF2207 domain-containing protein [Clostridiales bacterium]|nr:DUF2207 domain-containing protein [Clostridiales bacterium]
MKGLAIAGFVVSLVGLVLSFLGTIFSIVALPVAIVGLVLAVMAGKKFKAAGEKSGLATAGLVIGIIAVVISAILFFTCGICALALVGAAGAVA